jgi:hypothetical protein
MTKLEITVAPAKSQPVNSSYKVVLPDSLEPVHHLPPWKEYEKIAFRFFFIYFFLQAVPLDWKYYRDILAIDWSALHFRDIFYLARYQPRFFSEIATFADWGVVAIIAIAGTIIWSFVDKKNKEYTSLYYWLRVIVRYRLAVALIAYGFIKLFPMQAPLPSISNLNTNYGDLDAWKIFSLSLGIVPSYESFLGLVEILAGLLLFYRRTATIATLLILPFTGNVLMSNLAYEGGEYVYSFYLVVMALFLFAFDGVRLFTLLTFEKPTLPNRFNPVFRETWQKHGRLILKSAFIGFFVMLYGYKTYAGYKQGPYHFPQQPGLAEASGLYNVSEFRINNQLLPYSATDPIRWKDVVFEKWATLSIRSNRPVQLESAPTEEIYLKDEERNYELAGSAGRHYYSYEVDTEKGVLTLQNRNKNHQQEKLILHFTRPSKARIILSGINERNDSVYVVLDKVDKKYLLEEARQGRRKALKL